MTYPGVANSGEFFISTADVGLHRFGQILGDVSGTLESNTVRRIQGQLVDNATPVNGDIFLHNGTQWTVSAATGLPVGVHNLLSSTHGDTDPSAPTRGALIFGSGASPTWARLPLGTAEFVLYSDGTDVLYTRLGPNTPFELGSVGAPSMTFTGDLDTGISAANPDQLILSASGEALITVDNTAGVGLVTINAGQIVKCRAVGLDGLNATMLNDDYGILAASGSMTVFLPVAPTMCQVVFVKDRDGNAVGAANAITLGGNGNTIDGNANIQIRSRYGSFTLVYNGTEWNVI